MLTYALEERGTASLYEYLYECIRDDIVSGKLAAGEKLPSKRELARQNGVAVITVENAYAQLLVEGYIFSKPKSGYYVSEISEISEISVIREKNAGRGSFVGPGAVNQIRKKEEEKEPALIADFTSNRVKEDAFPFATWSKLTRRILAERESRFLSGPPAQGEMELREAIAGYLRHAKGIETLPEQIIVGPGTEYLHHVLLQVIGRSRLVAVENPGYKKVGEIYESNGMKVLHIPVDNKGMQVDKLRECNARLVHISPSHHFPTGCIMPIDRRYQLLSWAKEQEAYVIEDDYDSELRFTGRPIRSLASLDKERVIYMNTFTKTLAPSIRIAYMVLPEKLMQLYHRKLFFYSGAVSTFEQYTLAAFIKEGYYERHISRMRNYYKGKRAEVLSVFETSPLAKYASIEEDDAGLHFILKIEKLGKDEDFIKLLENRGVKIAPFDVYCYGIFDFYAHFFVLNYAAIDREQMEEAFKVMARTVEELC